MTPEQLAILADEVRTDPKNLGYAQYLPDSPGLVVDLINAKTQRMVKPLASESAKIWAAAGPYAKIVDASNDETMPLAIRSSCLIVRDSFKAKDTFDLDDPRVAEMFLAWVHAGVINQEEHDALIEAATVPASQAETLGLPKVTEYNLIECGVIP